jgi:hypothetical protein
MKRDKPNTNVPVAEIVSLLRGLYSRVARHLEVRLSYVSCVAR